MDLLDTVAGKIVAYTAAAAALVWLTRAAWKGIRAVWRGAQKLERILVILEWLEKEFKPNGGGSMRDAIDAVNGKLDDHLNDHAKVTVNVGMPAQPPQT